MIELAKSLAGHDKDQIYLITAVDGKFVYLCNGRSHKLANPKKKNCTHIQIIRKIPQDVESLLAEPNAWSDEVVIKALKIYQKTTQNRMTGTNTGEISDN